MEIHNQPREPQKNPSRIYECHEKLWDQAYDDLRQKETQLIEKFERLELLEPGTHELGKSAQNELTREQRMSAIITQKLVEMSERRWRLSIYKRSSKVRDQLDRIVKIVSVANKSTTVAVNADPMHAGLAWAPICLLLSFLQNDFEQRKDLIEGVEYVSTLLCRYTEIEKIYRQNDGMGPRENLQRAIKVVYRHILEFEARAILQFSRGTAHQHSRSVFVMDDWKGILDKIRQSDEACESILRVMDAEEQQMRLDHLQIAVDEFRRQVQADFERSRLQDQEYQQDLVSELKVTREKQQEWRQENKDWKLSEEESKCSECLRTTEYESARNLIDHPVPGTCVWFWEHPKYRDWHNKQMAWLFVTANPGCGKSVLLKNLVDVYEDKMDLDPPLSVCYFFFKDDSDANRSLAGALCALLHQLFTQNKALLKYAMPSFKQNGSKLSGLSHTLWDILVKATSSPEARRTICLIDAIDECEESGRSLLVKKLSEYYSKSDVSTKLKFLTTSRPDPAIKTTLRRCGVKDSEPFLLMGEDVTEMNAIAREIDVFIKARSIKLKDFRAQDDIHDNVDHDVQEMLANMHNRTYLWVALIFPELEENAGLPEKGDLLNLARNIPTTVNKAYEKMLKGSADSSRARKLLHIIVAAARPLTVTEINRALAFNDSNRLMAHYGLESESIFTKTIRKLCGHFVRIQDSKVFLIHQTAKDFLISGSPQTIDEDWKDPVDLWKHSFDLRESNLILAKSCVSYLLDNNFGNLGAKMLSAENAFKDRKQAAIQCTLQYEFLDYAAKFWFHHCRQTHLDTEAQLKEGIARLCDTEGDSFKVWFNLTWGLRPNQPRSFTDLIVASECGLEPVVRLLLERGHAHPDATNDYGHTALSLAVRWGHTGIVKLLLENAKVNPNIKDIYGRTPLWRAAYHGHQDIIGMLLDQEIIDANLRDGDKSTPLEVAILEERKETVRLLLECNKVDPNIVLTNGQILLHAVLGEEHQDILKILLQRNDVHSDVQNFRGTTALWIAARNGHEEVVEMLMNYNIQHGRVSDMQIVDDHGWTIHSLLSALDNHKLLKKLAEWHDNNPSVELPHEQYPSSVVLPIDIDLRIDEDGLTVIAADTFTTNVVGGLQVRSNHPIPPHASNFYFEVTVTSCNVGIGLCTAESDLIGLPGWTPGSYGYHGDDGYLYGANASSQREAFPCYEPWDTIGCGFNYETKEVSYSKNGRPLGVAFTELKGVLFPVVGILEPGTRVQFNFGGDQYAYRQIQCNDLFDGSEEETDNMETPQTFEYISESEENRFEGSSNSDIAMVS